MPLTALDFFAGGGLVTEGLRFHFRVVWANDNCPRKAATYRANHPEVPFHLADICSVEGQQLPAATLSWASFPCQDLSLAGRLRGLDGDHSSLVWQWLRVMDGMPRYPPLVVAENVLGLISAAGGVYYRAVHHALAVRGYRVGAVVLDAVRWLPQSRKRVFIIGAQNGVDTTPWEQAGPGWCHTKPLVRAVRGIDQFVWWRLPEPPPRRSVLTDYLSPDAPFHSPALTAGHVRLIPATHRARIRAAVRRGVRVFPAFRGNRRGKSHVEIHDDGVAYCICTYGGSVSSQILVFAEGARGDTLRTRYLTPRESARLMGLPERYVLPEHSKRDAYRVCGDGVAIPVVKYLARHLLAPLGRAARA